MSADPPARGPADDLDLETELADLHTPRDPQHEYRRLHLALSTAAPGQLYFVELATARGRRHLPVRLMRDGLARPSAYYNLAERSPTERQQNPFVSFRAFLAAASAAAPVEILYLDGFPAHRDFHLQPQPHDALEQLNLAREALARLPAAIVFLAPPYLIALLRQHTQNLWSWRHHDFTLSPDFDADAPQDAPWDFSEEVLPPLLAVDPEALGSELHFLTAQIDLLSKAHQQLGIPAEHAAAVLCEAGAYQKAQEVLEQRTSTGFPPLRQLVEARVAWALGGTAAAMQRFSELPQQLAVEPAGPGSSLVPDQWLLPLIWRHLLLRQTQQAQSFFQVLRQDKPTRLSLEGAKLLCAESCLSRLQGNLPTAETQLAKALQWAGPVTAFPDVVSARLLHERALLYLVMPQVERAEEAIRRATEFLEEEANPSIPLAAALHTLARVVALRDRSPAGREQAAGYLRRALAMAEEPLGPEHPALTPLRQELARLSPA